jgi:hypothetical protein
MHVCAPAQRHGAAYPLHHAKCIGLLACTGDENMRPMWRGVSPARLSVSGDSGWTACPLSRLLVARQRKVGMSIHVFMPCPFCTVPQAVAAIKSPVWATVGNLRMSTAGG